MAAIIGPDEGLVRPSIAVVGPTASGKTCRAVELARALNGEIISADSRQVYRGMDLGTGKDLEEYEEIPYHLIDICDAGTRYDLHRYLHDFHKAYEDVESRGKRAVICGGSGMYVENAVRGIQLPEVPRNEQLRARLSDKTLAELGDILAGYRKLHNVNDTDTVARALRAIEIQEYYRIHPEEAKTATNEGAMPLDCVVIGVDIPREERRRRISKRLKQRLDSGMIEEIRNLIDSGVKPEDLIYYGLEYKFITLHVIGELGYDEMYRSLETAIHQFAKRQMTWFRGMEKRGTKINWLPFDMSSDDFVAAVTALL